MPTLAYWFGFKNFENSAFIHKPDQIKNETFSVPSLCIFSAFEISVFSVCPDSTAIFSYKSAMQPL